MSEWLSSKFTSAHGLLVRLASFLLLGVELDHVVDAQNSDGRFRRELQRLHLRHSRLEHTCRLVVAHLALVQIQTDPDRTNTTVYLHEYRKILFIGFQGLTT